MRISYVLKQKEEEEGGRYILYNDVQEAEMVSDEESIPHTPCVG